MYLVTHHILLLFIVALTLLLSASSEDCLISSSEYNSLESIYNETDGLRWNYTTAIPNQIGNPWHFPSNFSSPCSEKWYGVSCTKIGVIYCKITELSLESTSLKGTLPEAISGLSSLVHLKLSRNLLKNPLPQSISNMSDLTLLDLGDNKFGGDEYHFPEYIFRISNLAKLVLAKNFWYTTIPQSISNLKIIDYLDFANNQFYGTLPNGFFNLINLKFLSLHGNRFEGLISSQISKLAMLGIINIGNNHFSGTFPPAIAEIKYLNSLFAEGNDFTSTIPETVGNMSSLRSLDLSRNMFQGTFPYFLSKLKLDYLNLFFNFMHGEVDNRIFTPSLQYFNLAKNNFTGHLPEDLWANVVKLEHLDMGDNRFSGHIPLSNLDNAKRLNQFVFNKNYLSGSIPAALSELSNLQLLSLESNRFSHSIPSEISSFKKLNELYLSENRLTGKIPSELSALKNLTKLSLYRNSLTSCIPSELSTLNKLRALIIWDNHLSCQIPSEMFQMTDLRYIDINLNNFWGSIPTSISNLVNLNELRFSNCCNFSSSSIPTEMGNLINLIRIDLGGNSLEGSIPQSFSQLTKLFYLYLDNNTLTGVLPSGLSSLQLLDVFDVSNNLLTHSIPPELCEIGSLASFSIGNNNLYGEIPSCFKVFEDKMFFLDLSSNNFHGIVGNLFENFRQLIQLSLTNNHLDSEITVSNCLSLTSLELGHNFFSGQIDQFSSRFALMQIIQLNSNYFEGTLPDTLSQLNSSLTYFDISDNKFHGDPFFFLTCYNLLYVNVSQNRFDFDVSKLPKIKSDSKDKSSNIVSHGLIRNKTTSSTTALEELDISRNFLSGTLPKDFFQFFPQLNFFSADKNCLYSYIPDSICDLKQAEYIQMSKLGSRCSRTSGDSFLQLFLTTVSNPEIFSFSIPDCLLKLSNLRLLNLGSNNLYGTLGDISSSLNEFYANSNLLIGTIPRSIQMSSNLTTLGLSFNRISGVLDKDAFSNIPADSKIELFSNRLSGEIPESIYKLNHIDILSGNLFACEMPPPGDYNKDKVLCQSDAYARCLYGFGLLLLILLVLMLSRIKYGLSSIWSFRKNLSFFVNVKLVNYFDQSKFPNPLFFSTMKLEFAFIVILISVILLLINYILSIYYFVSEEHYVESYNTLIFQYSYASTFAYTHGILAFALVFIGLLGNIIAYVYLHDMSNSVKSAMETISAKEASNDSKGTPANIFLLDKTNALTDQTSVTEENTQPFTFSALFAQFVAFLQLDNKSLYIYNALQLISVGFVGTINYGYIYAQSHANSDFQAFLPIILGGIKVFWNNVYLVNVIRFGTVAGLSPKYLTLSYTFNLINLFLLTPIVISYIGDTNCFFFLMNPKAINTNPTNYPIITPDSRCFDIQTNELSNFTKAANVTGNHCFESYSTNFITRFVKPDWKYCFGCGSSFLTNYLPAILATYVISAIMVPLAKFILLHYEAFSKVRSNTLVKMLLGLSANANDADTISIENNKIFRTQRYICNLFLDITMLFTFGIAAPFLSILIFIKLYANEILSHIQIGEYAAYQHESKEEDSFVNESMSPISENDIRYLSKTESISSETKLKPSFLDIFCDDAIILLYSKSMQFIMFSTLLVFWMIILFDMIADVYHSFYGFFSVFMFWIVFLLFYSIKTQTITPFFNRLFKRSNTRRPQSMRVELHTFNPMSENMKDASIASTQVDRDTLFRLSHFNSLVEEAHGRHPRFDLPIERESDIEPHMASNNNTNNSIVDSSIRESEL